jgi:hypothetical protein
MKGKKREHAPTATRIKATKPAKIPQIRPLRPSLLPSLLPCSGRVALGWVGAAVAGNAMVLFVPTGAVELLVVVGSTVFAAGVGGSILVVAVCNCTGVRAVAVHGGWALVWSGCNALLPMVQGHGGVRMLLLHTSRSVRCSPPPHTVAVLLLHASHAYA